MRQRDDEMRKATRRKVSRTSRPRFSGEPQSAMDDKFLEYDDTSLKKIKADSRNKPKKSVGEMFDDEEEEEEEDDWVDRDDAILKAKDKKEAKKTSKRPAEASDADDEEDLDDDEDDADDDADEEEADADDAKPSKKRRTVTKDADDEEDDDVDIFAE